MLYIAPRLGLTVVMTFEDTPRPTTIAERDAEIEAMLKDFNG